MPRPILLLLLLVNSALADEAASAAARSHYQKATALFNLGEWTDAAGEYKEAYKVLPEPVFLYNIAQAYRLGGDLAKAAFFYNSYAHNATDPATRHEAELRAKKIEAQLRGKSENKTETKSENKTEAKSENKTETAKTETKGENKTEIANGSEPSSGPLVQLEPGAAAETPGPAWAGGSERLGSMTDLIKKHRDQFRFCYDAWSKKHPKQDGHLKLTLTLAPDGTLQASEAHLDELKAPELERCIVAMSRQLTYPPSASGKMTRFSYPFEFKYR